jgi:acetyl-CoA carboxylase carboxyltransferase component
VANEEAGIEAIRELISYLPQKNLEEPPLEECSDPINRLDDALNSIFPDNPNQPYDMKQVITSIATMVNLRSTCRLCTQYYCRIARFNGISTGIVANQPNFLAGVLDCDSSRKAARLFASATLSIFLYLLWLTFPDSSWFCSGIYSGIITHGAKLMVCLW